MIGKSDLIKGKRAIKNSVISFYFLTYFKMDFKYGVFLQFKTIYRCTGK